MLWLSSGYFMESVLSTGKAYVDRVLWDPCRSVPLKSDFLETETQSCLFSSRTKTH